MLLLGDSNLVVLNGVCSNAQIRDLENLKKFIENPWRNDIDVKLNFGVFQEMIGIVENLDSFGKEQLMNSSKELDLEREKIKRDTTSIRNRKASDSLNYQNIIQELNSLYSQINNKDTVIVRKATNEIKEFQLDSISLVKNLMNENDTLDIFNTRLLNLDTAFNKNDIAQQEIEKIGNNNTVLSKFKIDLGYTKNAFNIFAENKETPIQQNNQSQQFKISESAVIEAITSAIIDQVQNGLYNLLIDNIFDDTINFGNTSFVMRNELAVLFPETVKELDELRNNRDEPIIPKLNYLKKIFNQDLSNILNNITDSMNYKKSNSTLLVKFEKEKSFDYLKFGVEMIDKIKNGFHPSDMISLVDRNSDMFADEFKEYLVYLSLIDELQRNLRGVSDPNSVWVSFTNLDQLNTENGAKYSTASYFLGFIYQLNPKKFQNLKKCFAPNDEFDPREFDEFKRNLNDFVVSLNTIESNIKNSAGGNTLSVENYLINLVGILADTEKSEKLAKYVLDEDQIKLFVKQVQNVKKYLEYVVNIYKTIHDGSYASLLKNLLKIYEKELTDPNADNNNDFIKELSKYVNLFVDVTNARSQEDINDAVNKAVGNWGGLTRKKEKGFVVSINSFVGLSLSKEEINSESIKGLNSVAFSVPLGINFQLFKEASFIRRGSVFLQLFDFTAVANYRWNADSNTTNLPETITFAQMLSPGIFGTFSLWFAENWPLCINFGVNVTPQLRSLTNDGKSIEKSKSVRYSIGISYDVPLWHIFSN